MCPDTAAIIPFTPETIARAEELTRIWGRQNLPDPEPQAPASVDELFKIWKSVDIEQMPDPEWLVHGLLVEGGQHCLYGAPGAGKSFLALHLAWCVGAGEPFFGMETAKRPVIYLMLEGKHGLKKRIKAMETARHARMPTNVGFILDPVLVIDEKERLIKSLQQGFDERPLIIIDTLSRAIGPRDECSGQDMTAFLDACAEIQRAVNGTALIIHHPGKDSAKGMRGHSSLLGALDTAIEVKANAAHNGGTWKVFKSKDGEPGLNGGYRLDVVDLGLDAKGKPQSSCVIGEIDGVAWASRPAEDRELNDTERKALDTLKTVTARTETGQTRLKDWRAEFMKIRGGGYEAAKKALDRSREKLEALGLINSTGRGIYEIGAENKDMEKGTGIKGHRDTL